MNLKILLPYMVFASEEKVVRIVAETENGSFGILPQRLDFVAALEAGILCYEKGPGGVQYVAIDQGIMIKTNQDVYVSVRNAIAGPDLGKLKEAVDKEFRTLNEQEQNVRSVMAKLESGFIQTLEKFRKD